MPSQLHADKLKHSQLNFNNSFLLTFWFLLSFLRKIVFHSNSIWSQVQKRDFHPLVYSCCNRRFYVVIIILWDEIKITTNFEISYFGSNFDWKSTYCLPIWAVKIFCISFFFDFHQNMCVIHITIRWTIAPRCIKDFTFSKFW